MITPGHCDAQKPGKETAWIIGQETGFWLVLADSLAEWLVDSGVKPQPFASGASIRQDGEIRNTLSA